MDQELWRRAEELFRDALTRAPETRQAFLDDALSGIARDDLRDLVQGAVHQALAEIAS